MNGIILRSVKSKKNNETKFTIWGTGTPIREWIYMGDVARLMKYIIDNNITKLPNPINLGQEIGHSIKDSVELVQKILDVRFDIEFDTTKIEGAPKKIMSKKLVQINNMWHYYLLMVNWSL